MTISIIRMPFVPQLWDGCDVSIPEDEYHARLNRYLYEWRYRYESTVNTIIGLTSPLTTKGDVWGFSTVNARIPVGANGYVLTADSTQALGVKWAASSSGTTSPLTTKGDLWGFSTVDARLPVGTNNFVLTADSTQALGVKWAAATTYTLTTKDEGTSLSSTVNAIDFTGARVTASGAGATTTVNIPATLTTKGQLMGFSTVEDSVPVAAGDGLVLTSDSTAATGVSWQPDTADNRWSWLFGQGTDGSAHCDGSTAVAGMSRSGSVYTLSRGVSYTNLTVDAGVSIDVANTGAIQVTGLLTNNGNIHSNGLSASGATPGAGLAASWSGVKAGGVASFTNGTTLGFALGGSGGGGGTQAGGGGIGGATTGGTAGPPAAANGSLSLALTLMGILYAGVGVTGGTTRYNGGCVGGGGQPTVTGGASGSAGGYVCIAARLIAGNGTFQAIGGNGGNGVSGNAGGGGGSGGGLIGVITTTANWASLITASVAAGTGGSPTGTGNFGADGSVGRIVSLVLA